MVFGLLESMFLYEGGDRIYDANMFWGLFLASFIFWVVVLVRFVQGYLEKRKDMDRKNCIIYSIGYVLLFAHVFWGVYYYMNLLGANYQY